MENVASYSRTNKTAKKDKSLSQCSETFDKDVKDRNDNDMDDKYTLSSPNSSENDYLQYNKNLINIEEENKENSSVSVMPHFEQKFDNFIRFVVRKSTSLEIKLNRLENNLTVILNKLSISNINVEKKDDIDVFNNLPLKNENNLQIMESKFKNDPYYRDQMMKQLTHATCDNSKISSLRLIKAIFSNDLATKFSWYGAKKKEIFSQLEICKVIMSIMRKTHSNITDEQIAGPIKVWLAHAKERKEKERGKDLEKEKESEDTH